MGGVITVMSFLMNEINSYNLRIFSDASYVVQTLIKEGYHGSNSDKVLPNICYIAGYEI